MLVNLTNHPSDKWLFNQKNEAELKFGKIIDIPFPQIETDISKDDLMKLAIDYMKKIEIYLNENNNNFAVLIMGELTFVYTLIVLLQNKDITCIATKSPRKVFNEVDNVKSVEFVFSGFRTYPSFKEIINEN